MGSRIGIISSPWVSTETSWHKSTLKTIVRFTAFQTSHFCCSRVYLFVWLSAFSANSSSLVLCAILSTGLHPQPLYRILPSPSFELPPNPSPRTLSLTLHLPLLTYHKCWGEGRISIFPIPLPLPNHKSSPLCKEKEIYFEPIPTNSIILFSFSSWSLSFTHSFAHWQ